ncbi:MAG: hypothetical protein Q9213_004584 [Squamulea squamosa]
METVLRKVFHIVERLNRNNYFFQLGGDSFTAIQTVAAAKEKGYDLVVRHIYQNPHLVDLAAAATPSPKTVPVDQAVPRRGTFDTFRSLRKEAAWLLHSRRALLQVPRGNVTKENAHMWLPCVRIASENVKENTSLASQFGQCKPHLEHMLSPYRTRQVLYIRHALYGAWTLDYFDDLNHNYLHPGAEKHGRRVYEYFFNHLAGLKKDKDAEFRTKQLAAVPLVVPFPETPDQGYKPSPQASIVHHLSMETAQIRVHGFAVATIDVFTPEDKNDILEWNPIPRPRSLCLLHELFAQAAARAPQSIAIDSCLGGSDLYSKISY